MSLVLIDGHNFVYNFVDKDRVYAKDETILTGYLEGFDYAAVIFDLDGSVFRRKIFKEYKANRKRTPDSIKGLLFAFEQMLTRMKVPWFSQHGVEADDLIASLLYCGLERNQEMKVVSNDKDFFQHLGCSDVYTNEGPVEKKKVIDKYGVEPYRLPEIWALSGDKSDNIPGVVAEEKAIDLIQKYGSLGGVLSDKKYKRYQDKVLRNFMLVQHNGVAPLNMNFEELSLKRFKKEVGAC